MGVLYCLDYMHQQNTPVTLRNLNSSCIYLTEDAAAKVADISYGVAKKEEDEYDAHDEYSTVYKFALLVLETISGRRPYWARLVAFSWLPASHPACRLPAARLW